MTGFFLSGWPGDNGSDWRERIRGDWKLEPETNYTPVKMEKGRKDCRKRRFQLSLRTSVTPVCVEEFCMRSQLKSHLFERLLSGCILLTCLAATVVAAEDKPAATPEKPAAPPAPPAASNDKPAAAAPDKPADKPEPAKTLRQVIVLRRESRFARAEYVRHCVVDKERVSPVNAESRARCAEEAGGRLHEPEFT